MSKFIEQVNDGGVLRSSGEWVKFKLDYLNRYLNIFENSMKDKWPIRIYIDILAGSGKNRLRKSDEILFGSPLLSLMTTPQFSYYIFNEFDSKTFNSLKTRIDAYPTSSEIFLFNEDCNQIVDDVVNIINGFKGNSLNFAFIDPEGLNVKWSTIEKLATQKRMDLLFYYPEEALNRNIKKLCLTPSWCKIDDFFGDDEWRRIFINLESKNNLKLLHRKLMDHLKNKLVKLGYVDFSDDHIHEEEPLMKSSKNAPLYRLIFASKHALGVTFWKKIVQKDCTGQKRLFP